MSCAGHRVLASVRQLHVRRPSSIQQRKQSADGAQRTSIDQDQRHNDLDDDEIPTTRMTLIDHDGWR